MSFVNALVGKSIIPKDESDSSSDDPKEEEKAISESSKYVSITMFLIIYSSEDDQDIIQTNVTALHKRKHNSSSSVRHAVILECVLKPLILEDIGQPLVIIFRDLGPQRQLYESVGRHEQELVLSLQEDPITLTELKQIPGFTINPDHQDALLENPPQATCLVRALIPDRYNLAGITGWATDDLIGVSIPLAVKQNTHLVCKKQKTSQTQ